MNFENYRAHAELRPYSRSIALHLYKLHPPGKITLLSNLVFTEHDEDEDIEPSEAILLPLETVQELMDSLWQCGLRPSEGTGSAGALKATENHLKDMQTIAFKLLDREKSNHAT